ncbi:hypothetical protein EGH21_02200 [Halomicroarcula sp. F13]|uniref:DUF7322 domain-containing protein n=1 Tax=Haloarcula rubra TaxID=2487747 RepID=A0AAW4PL43_9EURY|nr:hypothetical protein [Halomicroarcula rubra]MBX0321835.1 hypothetical protein [Halomicroarcula rubra]
MLDGPDERDPDGDPGVLSEKSPYEPDEFDPDSLGPDVPKAPRPPDGSGDSDVAALFWKLVLVFNVALLGLSVGPMLAYFEGRVDLGVRVFLVGLLAFGYGTFRYYKFRRDREDDGGAPDAETADDRRTDDSDAADHNG